MYRLIYVLATFLAGTMLLAILDAMADAGRLLASGTNEHHVRGMERCFYRRDATLGVSLGGAHRLLHDVDLLHHHAIGLRDSAEDLALLAAILASDHLDGVALADLQGSVLGLVFIAIALDTS